MAQACRAHRRHTGSVNVPLWVWVVTLVALAGVLAFDLYLAERNPHEFTVGEAARWVLFYTGLAIAFAVLLLVTAGPTPAAEFVAGWITEYSLSVDNLFVFVVIMGTFAVPAYLKHRVLLIGIVISLVLRLGMIVVGAALVQRFTFVFYLFGAFLIFTAVKVARDGGEDADPTDNLLFRTVRRLVPVDPAYHGSRMTIRKDGTRYATMLAIVILAIGTTDVLFALDSIPAIFGLTQEPYLVFTANLFALMGLRQLYFLVVGLLERLVYLAYGLALILGFIGVKLILHAAHETWSQVPTISIAASLVFIVVVLAVTTVASLWKARQMESEEQLTEIPRQALSGEDASAAPLSEEPATETATELPEQPHS